MQGRETRDETTRFKSRSAEIVIRIYKSELTISKRNLEFLICTQFSIKDDFYYMKHINDILFNHQLINQSVTQDEIGPDGEEITHKSYGKNIQKYTGKMLTAVFKDYLIYDDIYEFMEGLYHFQDCVDAISQYAKNMNSVATVKYGFKESDYFYNPENIVNRPSILTLNQRHQKILNNNLKMKYLVRYEKRVYKRAEQKKEIAFQKQEQQLKLAYPSQSKNYKVLSNQLKEQRNERKDFSFLVDKSQVGAYSSFSTHLESFTANQRGAD